MKYNDNQRSVYVGKKLTVEVFGASHAPEMGVKITGLKGENVTMAEVEDLLSRRKAKRAVYSTKRLEDDAVEITSPLTEDVFVAVIKNTAQRSSDYDATDKIPRPSHADYVAWTKYGDGYDHRGGGKFSGRLTAPMCIAGGICKEILKKKGIEISAYISSVGGVSGGSYKDIDVGAIDLATIDRDFPLLDESKKAEILSLIEEVGREGNSIGGTIECVIKGVEAGTGEYMFDSIESVISHLAFAVPAVKGIEFGRGFEIASMRGSVANDGIQYKDGKVTMTSNNNGGINGGIANGMPITFRVAIKPTPSIAIEQDTVDLNKEENVKLAIKGRHDACIVPRAVPVIEGIAAIAIFDIL